jgi:hypothetical protein
MVVLRFSSFLVGMSSVVEELASLHDLVEIERKKSFHLHYFESIPRNHSSSRMNVKEAIAALAGKVVPKVKIPIWRRIALAEQGE